MAPIREEAGVVVRSARAAAVTLVTGPLPLLAGSAFADVGYQETSIEVDHRDVPVPLHLWYPAEPGAPAEAVGRNAMFAGVKAHPGAPPLGEPAPVVLMSHGSGGNAVALGWIAVALAERGMIVAAPNHPGTTSGDSLPERTIMPWERAWDMVVVLDALRRDPPAGLDPDTDRVAALGFSLGGHTALRLLGAQVSKDAFIDYCDGNDELDCGWLAEGGVDLGSIEALLYEGQDRDPRIDAAVAVDPALAQATVEASLEAIEAPVLLVSLGAPDAIPAGLDMQAIEKALPNAERVFIDGAVHFSFLGECRPFGKIVIGAMEDEPICEDPGRSRAEIHAELEALIGGFLEDVLEP